jgi:hypothetical protein
MKDESEGEASVLKRMIMRRFERCVPGSNPGGGKFGKDEGRRMKDESDECFSDSSFRLHHSSFVLSPCGGTETTRACEARNPGSIPGGGMEERQKVEG